jgi:selT/selW/selH-like putative selenoprotein
LAAEIDQKYRVATRLIESGGGVFEVCVDGDLIFSKKELSRFPEHSEIFNALDAKQA